MMRARCTRPFLTGSALVALLFAACGPAEDSGSGSKGSGGRPGTGGSPGSGGSGTGGAPGTGGSGSGGSGSGGSGSGGSGMGGMVVPGSGGNANTGGRGGDTSTGGRGGDTNAGGRGGAPMGGGGRGGNMGTAGSGMGGSGMGGSNTGGMTGGGGAGMEPARSAGCGKTATRPDPMMQYTMQVSGTTRYYLIYVPTNYDPATPLPVIFAFHGLDMNNWWAAHDQSGFRLIQATSNRALLVFPQGSGEAPGTTSRWGNISSSWSSNATDLGFIDALLADVQNKYCVDTRRIFATGFSQGGMMTNALGCQRARVFRGVAPFSGWGPGGNPRSGAMGSCSDATAQPAALVTHGTADGVVTIDAGRATRDFWRTRNGCMTTSMAGLNGCVLYQGCMTGKPVGYCEHGGDHAPNSNGGANVWQFFSSLN